MESLEGSYLPNAGIREATLNDAAELAGLMSQLGYATTTREMESRLRAILLDDAYKTLVAEGEGCLTGMIGIRRGYLYETSGKYGHILALAVDRDSRRSGIGRSLLREAEQWLADQGIQAVVVNSGDHRDEAYMFYEALGYQKTGSRFVKTLD